MPIAKKHRTARLPLHPTIVAVLWGLFITIGLLLFQLIPSDASLLETYGRLYQWDSKWYEEIAVQGYSNSDHSPVPPAYDKGQISVAFFPAYPLSVRLLHATMGIPVRFALLLSSLLACWIFCTYLVLLLHRWRMPSTMIAVTVLLILSYPSAFYLVTGYSEALFLAMLLGMLYWQEGRSRFAMGMTILHGFVLSATRITGLALALYPMFRRQHGVSIVREAFLVTCILQGGLLFFLYCALRFGNWHLYFDAQQIGWGVVPRYGALFELATYQLEYLSIHLPSFGLIGRQAIPVAVLWFFALLALEIWAARRAPGEWKHRIGLYFCGCILFFLTITGASSVGMRSIIRYMLGVHVFLVLATMHFLLHRHLATPRMHAILGGMLIFALLLMKLHAMMSTQFMEGGWVA